MSLKGRVAVLSGNGLTMDAMTLCPLILDSWHPQHPLSWTLGTPGCPDVPLLLSLPRLKAALDGHDLMQLRSDFDRFAALSREARAKRDADMAEGERLEFQVRYFIAVAYAHLQRELDNIPLSEWRWVQWIKEMRGRLACMVSFNYDLLVEDALETAGVPANKIQVGQLPLGIGVPVIKPHGSVDFDISRDVMRIPFGFPIQNVAIVGNDAPVEPIPRGKLLEWRQAADIVLPAEYSPLSKVQWVRPAMERAREILSEVQHLVVAGLSYWPEDRAEVDSLIDALSPSAEVVIANPKPPADLLTRLDGVGRRFRAWGDGPPPL